MESATSAIGITVTTVLGHMWLHHFQNFPKSRGIQRRYCRSSAFARELHVCGGRPIRLLLLISNLNWDTQVGVIDDNRENEHTSANSQKSGMKHVMG